jgi:hypothetical protein
MHEGIIINKIFNNKKSIFIQATDKQRTIEKEISE